MGIGNSETTKSSLILIIGDSLEDPRPVIDEFSPGAFGFLCFSSLGLARATELIKQKNIDMNCCFFENIHGLADKQEFFRKCSSLIELLQNQCNAKLAVFCVGKGNIEALVLTAIAASRAQTSLRILFGKTILALDSSENALLDLLSTIVKEFNLSRYKEALIDIRKLNEKVRTSKGKSYAALLSELALAYFEWDCRRYDKARENLRKVVEILDNTKDDFDQIYDNFKSKINMNIAFLGSLISDQETLGAIDAFFNGTRRYDAGDDLVCILSLANCIEFCCRARLTAKRIDPDDNHDINKKLEKSLGEKAKRFFVEKGFFRVDDICPTADEPTKAHVTPGLSHKPGFVDLLRILELLADDFFKEISGVIEANENDSYLSVLQLNILRNRIVHKMGATLDEELPKAIKLSEYVLEKYLSRLVTDSPKSFPQLKNVASDSLLSQSNNYVAHLRLNLHDLTRGIFQGAIIVSTPNTG